MKAEFFRGGVCNGHQVMTERLDQSGFVPVIVAQKQKTLERYLNALAQQVENGVLVPCVSAEQRCCDNERLTFGVHCFRHHALTLWRERGKPGR